jgi:hypothetical protein
VEIEQAVYNRLRSDSNVSALVGDRIYPGQAPQSSVFPLLVYDTANRKTMRTLTGVVNLNSWSMHLDVWGTDYASVKNTLIAVQGDPESNTGLNGFRGSLESGQIQVRGIFMDDADESAESPIHAEENGLFRAGMNLSIWWGHGS